MINGGGEGRRSREVPTFATFAAFVLIPSEFQKLSSATPVRFAVAASNITVRAAVGTKLSGLLIKFTTGATTNDSNPANIETVSRSRLSLRGR